MKLSEVVQEARRQLEALTGHDVEGVTGVDRNGDGWVVTVEAVELRRTPSTMDVLGTYEVVLGEDGELQSFRRRRRHHRSSIDEEG